MNDDWVLGACGCWSVVSWGEKMVMTLALRLIFPHTTLDLVLNRNGPKVVLAGKLCTFTSYLPPESTKELVQKFLVLVQKKDMDFLHERSANKLSNSALGNST